LRHFRRIVEMTVAGLGCSACMQAPMAVGGQARSDGDPESKPSVSTRKISSSSYPDSDGQGACADEVIE